MSKSKAATETPENTEATAKGNTRRGVTEEDKRAYAALEEAQENRPEGKENWSLFQVTDPAGRMRWTWASSYGAALWQVAAEIDRYSVIAMDDVPTKSEVAGMLAALSPEDRAELLGQYHKPKAK